MLLLLDQTAEQLKWIADALSERPSPAFETVKSMILIAFGATLPAILNATNKCISTSRANRTIRKLLYYEICRNICTLISFSEEILRDRQQKANNEPNQSRPLPLIDISSEYYVRQRTIIETFTEYATIRELYRLFDRARSSSIRDAALPPELDPMRIEEPIYFFVNRYNNFKKHILKIKDKQISNAIAKALCKFKNADITVDSITEKLQSLTIRRNV